MAVRSPKKKFDLSRIVENCALDENIIKNINISSDELEKIYDDFITCETEFDKARSKILTTLNDELQEKCHSIRARIKNPDHLIGKIIRNIYEKPKKYGGISVENYNKIITDLIGVRIIILNRHDWKEIHNSLLTIFKDYPDRYAKEPNDLERFFDKFSVSEDKKQWLETSYHAEEPVVYITSSTDRAEYDAKHLRVDNSREHYRSIHYIIRYGKFYFEIQVRTLFEEGWLEFDHRVKYPDDRDNPKKAEYISILNSLAVAADHLIAFYDEQDFKHSSPKKPKASTAASSNRGSPPPGPKTFEEKLKMRF